MKPSSAVSGVTKGEVKAALEVLVPKSAQRSIPLKFNPTQYQIQKQNNFAEIAIPGLESPPLQFIRGGATKLSLDVLLDTSDDLEDVRRKYTDHLLGLLKPVEDFHAPPIVRFVWDGDKRNKQLGFRGVLTSVNIQFVLFTPEGVPIRAKASLSLTEYRPVEITVRDMGLESSDFGKRYMVRAGDSLASIAAREYRDPGKWRVIAEHNDIRDPRRIEPGRELSLPRLR